ncbi:MAG: penicillin-binding protein, partial [Solirubrobacteraceae bacterium]|nr:penicillin-binding protein [Solirubrobacteraceae bacterium]
MSEDSDTTSPIPLRRPRRRRRDDERPPRPRVRKLRLALILAGLSFLALVSTVFGMMMAVAADLPKLEDREQFRNARNSELQDLHGKPLGFLTGPKNVVLVGEREIATVMQNAIVAIEDKRFYQNQGVDLQGMGRALWSDVIAQKAVQGASTITQQFVKNALSAQNNRTIFEKLREAALAYHLSRKWTKGKILTEYLNSTYFGNGAYGIESAARTYFGKAHPGCGKTDADKYCAYDLRLPEAALLAGIVASPSAFDPIAHPVAATARRNLVLRDMLDQGYISGPEYDASTHEVVPAQADITPPQEKTAAPYFTSWVRQQIVNRFGATRAFAGGLHIRTSLDLDLQGAAQQAVNGWLSGPERHPSAALVAIDNKSGEVRAMVGGDDYSSSPFNLATQGERQPGSAFKPFTLAAALEKGYSPDSQWSSRRKIFSVPGTHGIEKFVVNNFGNSYSGTNSLAGATTVSDNSVYAEVGIDVGTRRIARLAQRMGIRTPVSHNFAMILGGLKEGVTPLDLAHAYETFSTGGKLVTDPALGAAPRGPVGIHEVRDSKGKVIASNEAQVQRERVLPPGVAGQVSTILQTVVQSGTGTAAAIPGFAAGKTGTTENYGDAWFVGWSDRLTVAVWVGYPQKLTPMKTDFRGGPVEGGTFPALIWHDFMTAAQGIFTARTPNTTPVAPAPGTVTSPTTSTTTTPAPAATTGTTS